MSSIWRVLPSDLRVAKALASTLGLHPLTVQLLLNRGVTTAQDAERFLRPRLGLLADPMELPDMARAVERIRQAIVGGEPVLIFGDSDVDGITASVILYEVIRALGGQATVRLSNRIEDGYGLPRAIFSRLRRASTRLLILVDCGTNQPEPVAALARQGIETVIIDHHVPLASWAEPVALINPYREGAIAGRGLCSAGLALKVAQALLGESGAQLEGFVDLAALGTLADCAPLVGDNRIVVAEGVRRMLESPRQGLRRLCEATGVTAPSTEQLIRRLIPRMNASGRLGDPTAVWQVLLREPGEGMDEWIAQTETAHATTKQLHREIVADAQEQVNRLHFRDQYVVVVSRAGWHQGLMGPLASQLAQRYGRPAIAIAMDETRGVGSARSIPLFNLLEALKACQGVLVQFGGHAQACGLTVDRKHLDAFRLLINQHAQHTLGRHGLQATVTADLELPLEAVEPAWVEQIGRFAPFGQGNPRPSVVIRHVGIELRSIRTAVVTDGTCRVRAKGRLPLVAEGYYDVVALPVWDDGELTLTVSDARASAGPWGHAQPSGTPCRPSPAGSHRP